MSLSAGSKKPIGLHEVHTHRCSSFCPDCSQISRTFRRSLVCFTRIDTSADCVCSEVEALAGCEGSTLLSDGLLISPFGPAIVFGAPAAPVPRRLADDLEGHTTPLINASFEICSVLAF
jgi:hypothetical protein